MSPFELMVLPLALGLLGFVEPCTLGTTLLFVDWLGARPPGRRLLETLAFAGARATLVGLLGLAAALVGTAFTGFQRAVWIGLGSLYLLLGTVQLLRRRPLGMRLSLPGADGRHAAGTALGLGLLFGLNIPACAAPLLALLLGTAAAAGASGLGPVTGFLSLALFGFALSLPVVAAVALPRGRRALEALRRWTDRVPRLTGAVLVAVGVWSVVFALTVDIPLVGDGAGPR